MQSLRQEIEEIISRKKVDIEEIKSYESVLKENSNSCLKKFNISALSFLGLLAIWILVKFSFIKNVKFFDAELTDSRLIVVWIPFIAAFVLYRTVYSLIMHSLIDQILLGLYEKMFPNLISSKSKYFLTPPSFISFETFIMSEKFDETKFEGFNMLWTFFLGLAIFGLPIFFLGWMIFSNILMGSFLSIFISVISILILIRTISLIVAGVQEL